jgi:hypothetical protein
MTAEEEESDRQTTRLVSDSNMAWHGTRRSEACARLEEELSKTKNVANQAKEDLQVCKCFLASFMLSWTMYYVNIAFGWIMPIDSTCTSAFWLPKRTKQAECMFFWFFGCL